MQQNTYCWRDPGGVGECLFFLLLFAAAAALSFLVSAFWWGGGGLTLVIFLLVLVVPYWFLAPYVQASYHRLDYANRVLTIEPRLFDRPIGKPKTIPFDEICRVYFEGGDGDGVGGIAIQLADGTSRIVLVGGAPRRTLREVETRLRKVVSGETA